LSIEFTKMHGLGNDFVVLDATREPLLLDAERVRRIARRRFGIGCDQVLVVEPPPSTEVDFGYRIFNADGSEVGQCGNGARCLAQFVREKGLFSSDVVRVQTRSGRLELRFEPDGQVTVDMGVPSFEPADLPMTVAVEAEHYRLDVDGELVEFGAVSMGNPHIVLEVDDVRGAPVERLGPLLESHPLFPERVNVGFMQRLGRDRIRVRVFERGSGETLACGSGACAAVAVGCDRGQLRERVTVELNGGELVIQWTGRDQPVYMTGPAVTVYEGRADL
jgi:diaminopimelate epimerase